MSDLFNRRRRVTIALSVYNAVSRSRKSIDPTIVVAILRAAWTPGPALGTVEEVITQESVCAAFDWLEQKGLAKKIDGKLSVFRTPTGFGYPLIMNGDRTELKPLTVGV